jgi:hypothetical protein
MTTPNCRVDRIQKTLSWFENDVPLLNMRVRELSLERQRSAQKFAAALIDRTRAELERLLQEEREATAEATEFPCEPAD